MASRAYFLPDEWAYVVSESSYATSSASDAVAVLLTEPIEIDPSIETVERETLSGYFGTQVDPHNFVEIGVSFTMVMPKLPWQDGSTLTDNPLAPVLGASRFEFTESPGSAGADSHTYTFSLSTVPDTARSMRVIGHKLADQRSGGTRQVSEIDIQGVVGTVELAVEFGEMVTLSFDGVGIVDTEPFWRDPVDPASLLVGEIPTPNTDLNAGYRGFVARPDTSSITYTPITNGAQRLSSLTASIEGSTEQMPAVAGDATRVVHEQSNMVENPTVGFTTPHVEEDLAAGGILDEWETALPTTQNFQANWTQDSNDGSTDTSQLKVIADHYHPTDVSIDEEGGRQMLDVTGTAYHESGDDNLTIEIEATEL